MHSFRSLDYAPTGAKCGCVLFRQYKYVKTLKVDENGMYKCSVCEKEGGQNRHEVEMLGKLRSVLDARKEHLVLCCQFPVVSAEASGQPSDKAGDKDRDTTILKCDVVVVPCDARDVYDLIAVELDSDDHGSKPRQNRQADREKAYNLTVDNDSRKNCAVNDAGMRLLRVQRDDMAAGMSQLNTMLDSLQCRAM